VQIGSDLELLADGLRFLGSLEAERCAAARGAAAAPLRLYGSVFVPSRQLLARMKFRPWNGAPLSEILTPTPTPTPTPTLTHTPTPTPTPTPDPTPDPDPNPNPNPDPNQVSTSPSTTSRRWRRRSG
jgi:hypothetical protein